MTNKYFIGLVVFPLVPLALYFLDFLYLDGLSVQFSEKFFTFFGFSNCGNSFNFYCYQYSRSVYFLSLFLSPFFISFWFFFYETGKIYV